MKLKLQHLFDSVKADMLTIAQATGITLQTLAAPEGKTGLRLLHGLLSRISFDRAYDDTHPAFVQNQRTRYLPYDGRDYCFIYFDAEGKETCNDTHVASLLRALQQSFKEDAEHKSFSYPKTLEEIPADIKIARIGKRLLYQCPDSCWSNHFGHWKHNNGTGPEPFPFHHTVFETPS